MQKLKAKIIAEGGIPHNKDDAEKDSNYKGLNWLVNSSRGACGSTFYDETRKFSSFFPSDALFDPIRTEGDALPF